MELTSNHGRRVPADLLRRVFRDDRGLLALLVAASAVVHGALLIRGIGEPDTARLINDAIIWAQNPGYLSDPDVEYRGRVLPLTMIILRGLLRCGVAASDLPAILNAVNLAVGALGLVPLFLVCRCIAGRSAGYLALAFASVMPAFWFANIYGYPHLPSFALFLVALYLFLVALNYSGPKLAYWSLAAALTLGVGLGIKADLVLACGAFFGALWIRRRVELAAVAAAALVCAFGAFVPWMLHELMARTAAGALVYAAEYERIFPASLSTLVDPANVMRGFMAAGWVLSVLILFALASLWRVREQRPVVVFVLAWAVPVSLFWGLRDGNSSRHMMSAVVPMALVLAILFQQRFHRPAVRWSVVCAVLAINHALGISHGGSVSPSSRLIAGSLLLQDRIADLHREADAIAERRDAKVFLVGSGTNPYATFAMLRKARAVRHLGRWQLELVLPDGATQILDQAYVVENEEALSLIVRKRAEGYRVVSLEYLETDSASPVRGDASTGSVQDGGSDGT